MNSNHPIYLGVMSGTSLDGVDVVAFTPHNNALIAAHSIDFSTDLRNKALVLQQASNNELHHAQLVSEGVRRDFVVRCAIGEVHVRASSARAVEKCSGASW